MVRCARCGGEWEPVRDVEIIIAAPEPMPPAAEPEVEPALVLPAVTAMDRLAADAAPPTQSAGLIGAWILTVLVLTAALSAIIIWRQDFMSVWPPSGRILAPIDHWLSKPERIAGKTAG
jgi:hypothetical protein